MLTSSIVITDASGVSSKILPKLNPIYAPLSVSPSPTPTLKVTLVGSFAFKVIRLTSSCTYQFLLLLSIHENSAVLSTSEVSVALTSYTAPFFRVTLFCFRFTFHAAVPAFVVVTVALFSVKSHFPSAGLITSPDQPSSPFEKSPFFNRFVPSGSSGSSVSPESSPLILIMLTSSIIITDASGVFSEILPKLNPIYAPLSVFPSPTPTLKVTSVGSFAFKSI